MAARYYRCPIKTLLHRNAGVTIACCSAFEAGAKGPDPTQVPWFASWLDWDPRSRARGDL